MIITIITTWQNVNNHTIEILYGHHYTKIIDSTVLFTSMIISIMNLAKKQQQKIFHRLFPYSLKLHVHVIYCILFAVGQMIACVTRS